MRNPVSAASACESNVGPRGPDIHEMPRAGSEPPARADKPALAKCLARIRRLVDQGHELRRPKAGCTTRILYFFHGRNVALLTIALVKEGAVSATEIERAIRRLKVYEKDPEKHAHELESPYA